LSQSAAIRGLVHRVRCGAELYGGAAKRFNGFYIPLDFHNRAQQDFNA
jgi:hypothetical protein